MPGIISSVTIGLGEDSYSKPVPLRPGMTPTQVFAKVDVTRSTNVALPPTRFTRGPKVVLSDPLKKRGEVMAKATATRKRVVRRDWTRADVKELRQHSRNKTPVKTVSRALKRTPGALRQKARLLGIPLGHRRPKKKRA